MRELRDPIEVLRQCDAFLRNWQPDDHSPMAYQFSKMTKEVRDCIERNTRPARPEVERVVDELENQFVQVGAILESIEKILDGYEASDFMMSFPIVRQVWDLRQTNLALLLHPVTPGAGKRYMMHVPVEVRQGPCSLIMRVDGEDVISYLPHNAVFTEIEP